MSNALTSASGAPDSGAGWKAAVRMESAECPGWDRKQEERAGMGLRSRQKTAFWWAGP